jgi:UPF0176 protein
MRMKVRLKKEIVTMGVEDLDPVARRRHLCRAPEDWNALDRRSGHDRHRHAQRLRDGDRHCSRARSIRRTASFREFPGWAQRTATDLHNGPQGGHVLHRRHPLREGDGL